jgi:hypothetical protein
VVDAALAHEQPDRLAHVMGIDAVELQAARRLLLAEARHEHRLAIPLDEGASGDHLAHVEAGPVAAAQRAERGIGHARHGREHDRRPDPERADGHGGELAGPGGRDVAIDVATVDGIHGREVSNPT